MNILTSLKKFNILPQQFVESDIFTTEGEIRKYHIGDKVYPSITSVLSRTMDAEKSIILGDWQARVGEDGAEEIKQYATGRGDQVHTLIEKYILADPEFLNLYNSSSSKIKRLFNQAKDVLDDDVDNVRLLERPLYSKVLKIAGRVDMVSDYKNKISIVDFKTSTKRKIKSEITDYFIQKSFYALCFKELYGENIEQIVTLITTENGLKASVFVEDPRNYYPLLINKVKQYYKGVK
jgi:hypothetical protein